METYFIIVIFTTAILIAGVVALAKYLELKNFRKRYDRTEKQKSNYESIIDQANDAMLVIDIVDGKVHQANPSASRMLGFTKTELEKKTLFELHPREMLEKSSRVVADVWEKGGLIYKDIPFLTAGKELLPVECSAKVAPFAGRPAIVIYARDIRERLRMEKEIHDQKEIIEQKNKDITDSINYAKRIQEAMLTSRKEIASSLDDFFILFKPKDIVSGDFYWYGKRENEIVIAAADCTGHGVPGAFMSMIGNSFLEQIVNQQGITEPSEILRRLRTSVITALKQTGADGEQRDGMDIALCTLDLTNMKLKFSGAQNPLYHLRNGKLNEFKGNKFPVGLVPGTALADFSTCMIDIRKGDCIYIFSDGFADQFGGPSGKKFKYKQFQEILLSVCSEPMERQGKILDEKIEAWKSFKDVNGNEYEQIDDILVIGVRI